MKDLLQTFSVPAGPDTPPRRHVVIIGGGASGVLMAVHLLRQPQAPRVTLIEGRGVLGQGIAYATTDPEHLLNTRVHNMSAFPADPQHFHRWLVEHSQGEAGVSDQGFVSRATYGAYLAELLADWDHDAQLQRLYHEAVDLTVTDTGVAVTLTDGTVVAGDEAVLATGHVTPDQAREWPVAGAWQKVELAEAQAQETVVIIGSGLSMVDQVLSILRSGHRGPILSISRRGLLPRDHAATAPLQIGVNDLPSAPSAASLLRWARGLARQAEARGGTWRDAVDGIRPHVRRLWRGLPLAERARFLRHAATWWDVHRHRIPPQSQATLDQAILSGQLAIRKGAFLRAEVLPEGGHAALARPFGTKETEAISAARIVDCRGIRRDPELHATPLIRALLTKGEARIDPLRIGLDVDDQGRLIRTDGSIAARIHAIGPASRAAFWEITAIPDIREQVARLAGDLAAVAAL